MSIPELGSVTCAQTPLVFLTSNNSRELSEALKRSETIDWAQTLFLLAAEEISTDLVVDTLHVLLKHQSDIEKATTELQAAR